jgi:hypothetical protein
MKKLAGFLITAFMLISVFSGAQQSTAADVPDKADVMKFLDLMHAKAQMVQALDGMAKQMRLGVEQGFKSKVPNATPEQLYKVGQLFDDVFKDLPIEEMIDALVPIYQKHLTKSDLAAITAFYESAPGKKILKELPAITAESMQVGGEIGRKAFAAKSEQFDQRMNEFMKATEKN